MLSRELSAPNIESSLILEGFTEGSFGECGCCWPCSARLLKDELLGVELLLLIVLEKFRMEALPYSFSAPMTGIGGTEKLLVGTTSFGNLVLLDSLPSCLPIN